MTNSPIQKVGLFFLRITYANSRTLANLYSMAKLDTPATKNAYDEYISLSAAIDEVKMELIAMEHVLESK